MKRGKYHPTPKSGYKSLLERIFGQGRYWREMRNKKGLGDFAEYSTNKAGTVCSRTESHDSENRELNRVVRAVF
jgi:hypothetical protein